MNSVAPVHSSSPRPSSRHHPAPDPARWTSWAIAVAATFLALGLWNLASREVPTLSLQLESNATTEVFLEETPTQPPSKAEPTSISPPEPVALPQVESFEMPALPDLLPIEPAPELVDPKPLPKPEPVRTSPTPNRQTRTSPKPPTSPANPTSKPRSMKTARGRFPQPPYPEFALDRGLSGTVTVLIAVDQGGKPDQVRVTDSSGFPALDRHVRLWIQRRWRWQKGQAGLYTQPVIFELRR